MKTRRLTDQMGDPTTEGRLQMYLVLGALACADMERMEAFIIHGQAIQGRKEMYERDTFDQTAFTDRARTALRSAGFSAGFVEAIQWSNFTEDVWKALKVLRKNLVLLEDTYDAPDCPCMSVLVAQAIAIENQLEPLRKVNKATQRALAKLAGN
jgi:hypothetical protein